MTNEGSAGDRRARPCNPGDGFGAAVAGTGDVNNDGYDDVLVGTYGYDVDFTTGTARLYLGSDSGLPATPSWTADATTTGSNFGTSVAGAGDVNGDGIDDFLIGAKTDSQVIKNAGAAFLFYGSASLSGRPAAVREWQFYH